MPTPAPPISSHWSSVPTRSLQNTCTGGQIATGKFFSPREDLSPTRDRDRCRPKAPRPTGKTHHCRRSPRQVGADRSGWDSLRPQSLQGDQKITPRNSGPFSSRIYALGSSSKIVESDATWGRVRFAPATGHRPQGKSSTGSASLYLDSRGTPPPLARPTAHQRSRTLVAISFC